MERKAKILLVDDDPDFVEATRLVLESKPYEVVSAFDGDEGLEKARSEKPDLIILDIMMPRKDGFAVCQELKEDHQLSQVPVLMLTSFSERYMETTLSLSQGLAMEAEDFIDKPVSLAELLIRVERLLKKASSP
ncbi:response regulator transcription factor [Chloroflexota bacterium]